VFPVAHLGGPLWLVAGLMTGLSQLLVSAFDPKTTIGRLRDFGVTLAGAGTAFHLMYLDAQRAQPDVPLFPAVRAFPGGAAPKPAGLHHTMKRELGGVGIVSSYGLTEAPIIAACTVHDPDERLASTEGRATAGVSFRVAGEDGADVAPGEEGELRVRGPQLFRGYVNPSLDDDAFDDEGWFRTGDLARLDDGYVTITGRLKDVIIRKGENISASEVEDALFAHPLVRDAAVIGLPDERSGERVCAVVVTDAGSPLALDDVTTFLRDRGLMPQKLPEQLEQVDELPRNAMGKVLKGDLRKRFGPTT
jgi:acyl-CoA synthetase (AMP-forming)/AMP-acid ligase II